MEINEFVSTMKMPKAELSRNCKIKKYIKIEEKMKLIEELEDLTSEHIKDFSSYSGLVGYVFFNLLIVKYYTDIQDFELTYENYDKLQELDLISKIIEAIGQDCLLLQNLVHIKSTNNG